EEPVAAAEPTPPAPVLHDVHLELEELDLDSLQELAGEPLSGAEPAGGPPPAPPSPFQPEEVLAVEEDTILTLSGLEELETVSGDFVGAPFSPAPEPVVEPDDSLAHLPEAATLLEVGGIEENPELATFAFADEIPDLAPAEDEPAAQAPEPVAVLHELSPGGLESASQLEIGDLEAEEPASLSAAGGQAPAVPGHDALMPAEPAPASSDQARAVVQAIVADPVLVDALVRALVARMGDQVLREIAWEVMPDLAGRLQG
ncbi:MAG: hypothetical protein P4L11_11205, partial [Geothrix sp.]|nr:hypothetical protein [Geothrix sp.]